MRSLRGELARVVAEALADAHELGEGHWEGRDFTDLADSIAPAIVEADCWCGHSCGHPNQHDENPRRLGALSPVRVSGSGNPGRTR